jgi:hypothetical protein
MDLLEDTYVRRGHGSESVHGFESYIELSMFMLSFMLVIACGLHELKRICFFIVCLYVLLFEVQFNQERNLGFL